MDGIVRDIIGTRDTETEKDEAAKQGAADGASRHKA